MPKASTADINALNRQSIIDYWEAGFRDPAGPRLLGLEVEHHVVTDDDQPVFFEPRPGVVGVREVLDELSVTFPEREFGADGDLIGLSSPEASITLEPAGQIEASVAPHQDVSRVMAGYEAFLDAVGEVLGSHGAHLEAVGYNPVVRATDTQIIPKRRYHYMAEYFEHIGTHAERMMRTTASTQVSIDYASEADAIRKIRHAVVLTPVLAAIMDNTHVFEGEPNHRPLRRLDVWRDVDPARCGIQPGLFERGYGFAQMADWLLATPPIFVTRPAADDPTGPSLRYTGDTPAAEAYGDAPMTHEDVAHLISMFWPHARLKHVVEIRPADSAPRELVGGYVALVKGVFYSEDTLGAIEDALGVRGDDWPVGEQDFDRAVAEVQAHGHAGLLYGRTLDDWERLLFSCARAALAPTDAARLDALEAFAADKSWWQVS